jgi:hypothetical protein
MRNDRHQYVAVTHLFHASSVWRLQRLGFEILHHPGFKPGLARRSGRSFAMFRQIPGCGRNKDNWPGYRHTRVNPIIIDPEPMPAGL